MPTLRAFGLRSGNQAKLALLGHPGMVARELKDFAIANLIATRIADVRYDGLVVTQCAGNDGGCHMPAAAIGMKPFIMNG